MQPARRSEQTTAEPPVSKAPCRTAVPPRTFIPLLAGSRLAGPCVIGRRSRAGASPLLLLLLLKQRCRALVICLLFSLLQQRRSALLLVCRPLGLHVSRARTRGAAPLLGLLLPILLLL